MALEGGEGSASRPGCSLPPGKTRYPLYRRLGGPQGWSGQVRKILPPPGFDPRTVQSVERQGSYPSDRCNVVNVRCLVSVLEDGAVSAIVPLAELCHMQETYCILPLEFGWFRTKQYTPSALFWVICCEFIIIIIQSLV
jgi:hypothetical protein